MIRALALCALFAAAAAAQNPGGTLRFCLRSEPRTLDPHRAGEENSETVRYLTGGVLVRLNRATQRAEPALALSWKITESGRQITFQLRPGVRFSDGTPFTSADVAFTIRRLTDPAIQSPMAESIRSADGPIEVSTPAPDRVTIRFPAVLSGLPLQFDQISILSGSSPLKEKAVLGPFAILEHKPGQYLTLARNKYYWKRDSSGRTLPYLDAIRLDIQPNREIEMLRFRRGEVHLINRAEPDLFERLASERPDLVRDAGPSLESDLMWFNLSPSAPIPAKRREWFAQAEFRRAVSEAIQRADMCRLVFKGRANPASGPVSRSNQFWFNQSLEPLKFDPSAASRRLEKAGFRRQGSQLVDRSGTPVEFSLVTNANKTRERIAAMIQQDLGRIGIRVNIVPLDFPSLIGRMTRTFDYEACLLVLTNAEIDPNGQMNVWMSSGPMHQWNPGQKTPATPWEAEVDKLMRAQASTADPGKRKSHFDRVQKIAVEQMPFVFLVNKNALSAAAPGLGNLRPSVLQPHLYWNAEELYWTQGKRATEASGAGGGQ